MQRLFLHFAALILLAGCAGRLAANDLPADPLASGKKLYVAKCAKCHKFYDPAKYADAEWATWMAKMSRKARLKPDQQALVSQYVEETLRAPRKAEPPVPPSP